MQLILMTFPLPSRDHSSRRAAPGGAGRHTAARPRHPLKPPHKYIMACSCRLCLRSATLAWSGLARAGIYNP